MAVLSLNHVAIIVQNLDAARQFYEDVLGLRPVERPAEVKAGGPGIWYGAGAVQLHLFVDPDARETSIRHVGIEVDDLDDVLERAMAQGITAEDAFPFGRFKRRRFIRDPWGNLLELMSCS